MKVKEPKTQEDKIKALHEMKAELLNKYGIFGGGPQITKAHLNINAQLEELGVEE